MTQQAAAICAHPACGHPLSMHDDGSGGCTAPSDHLSKDFGGEIGEQPLPCICSQFRSSAPKVEDAAVELPEYDAQCRAEIAEWIENQAYRVCRQVACRERQLLAALTRIRELEQAKKGTQL